MSFEFSVFKEKRVIRSASKAGGYFYNTINLFANLNILFLHFMMYKIAIFIHEVYFYLFHWQSATAYN